VALISQAAKPSIVFFLHFFFLHFLLDLFAKQKLKKALVPLRGPEECFILFLFFLKKNL